LPRQTAFVQHFAFLHYNLGRGIHSLMPFHTAQHFSRIGQCQFLNIDEDQDEFDTSSLRVRVVRSPTREALLSTDYHGHFTNSGSDSDATTLLLDLNHLAPSVAKDFVPKTQAEASVPLRLLNDIDFHGEENGYIALSYCRRQVISDTPRRIVTPVGLLPFGMTEEIEQFPLPTINEVFQAVLRERRLGEGLFYDQVCVDQENEAERFASMGCIDVIYKNARTIVVVLDDLHVMRDEERLIRYYAEQYGYLELSHDHQPNLSLSPPLMHQQPRLWSFFERLLSSSWFEQARCAHEMESGQDHIFFVPCYSHEDGGLSLLRFTGAFFLHLLALSCEVQSTTPAQYTKICSLYDLFQRKSVLRRDATIAIHRPDTPQHATSDRRSFLPKVADIFQLQADGNSRLPEYLRRLDANREKMGIALNASGLPLAMTTADLFSRPNTEDECLRSLLLVALAARDPVALCTNGTPLRLHDGSTSWLSRPTPSDVHRNQATPPRFSKRAARVAQGSDGRAEYAQLNVIFLELPHRTQPNPHFPTQVARARMIIDLCIHYRLTGSALWDMWQSDHARAPTMRNTFVQTLACILECGPQWLLDLSTQLNQPGCPTSDPYTVEILLNPHLIVQNYILLQEGQAALSSLLTLISTMITTGIPWASGASERSHGPLIVAAPTSNPHLNAYDLHHTNTGKAIIFAPFGHSRTLLIAVPEVVKEAHYSNLARGWVLTSMNPYTGSPKQTVSWTLQSKGVLFGDGNFRVGLERCGEMDVRNHRVYGPSAR
jgi:hypothetical protein